MALKVFDRLTDERLEFLQDDHTVHPLLPRHLDWINVAYPHVLFLDLQWCLFEQRCVLLF